MLNRKLNLVYMPSPLTVFTQTEASAHKYRSVDVFDVVFVVAHIRNSPLDLLDRLHQSKGSISIKYLVRAKNRENQTSKQE